MVGAEYQLVLISFRLLKMRTTSAEQCDVVGASRRRCTIEPWNGLSLFPGGGWLPTGCADAVSFLCGGCGFILALVSAECVVVVGGILLDSAY